MVLGGGIAIQQELLQQQPKMMRQSHRPMDKVLNGWKQTNFTQFARVKSTDDYFHKIVVMQLYETQVYDEFVISGNVAVLKCHIPSYVRDHVIVIAWIREDKSVIKMNDKLGGSGSSKLGRLEKTSRDWMPHNNGNGGIYKSTSDTVQGKMLTSSNLLLDIENDVSIKNYPEPYLHECLIRIGDSFIGDLYIVQPSGNLYIRRATKDHQQLRYWCQTKHLLTGETKMSSTSGRVVVSEPEGTVPPRITDREAVIEAKEGEEVKIHCAGQGRPPPLYSWFYKDENGKITEILTSNVILDKEILLIERTKKEHSGTYLCVVSNNAGKQQTETTIIIKSPLTVYITPQTTVADADSSANFTCSVSGGPAKVISWLKNGYPLNLNELNIEISEDQKTLSIEKVSKESEAMYQCMAENSQDSGQGSAQLVLGASKPVVATGFSKIVLKNGMNLRLQCEVYGKPIPDIRWFLDGQRIVQNHRISIKLKQAQNGNLLGELSTDSITAENSGDYSCLTTNEAGSASHSARIDVYGVPSIRAFRNLTVISGSIIKVKCYVLDGDIPLLSDRYDVTDRILTINKVDKVSDTGRFTCTVNNRKGQTATQHLWINVLEKPLLDDMMDKDVEQEISLKLMCSAIKGDSPIAFTWKFNSQPLPDNRGLMVTKHSDVSLLMIPSVQIVHQGNYTCIASNEAGSANKTAKVTVRSPPSWNKIPKNTKLTSKGRVRLDCEARGNPPPYIAWYIIYGSKEKILLNNSTRQTVLQNGSLILWNVEEKDYIHDKFECVVNNGLGKLSNTFKLKRGVEVKVSVDNEEIISHLGDSIQMNCRITGSEPLSVKWTVNYQVIKPSSKYILSHQKNKEELISKLSIDNYMERDSGEYKCLASNTLGKQFKTITLATVDVLFQNDVGPEHVTLKKDEDNLLDLVIPMTAVCGVALLVVLLTLVCIKVRNSRRSTSTPIYVAYPPVPSKYQNDRTKEDIDRLDGLSVRESSSLSTPLRAINNKYVHEEVPDYFIRMSSSESEDSNGNEVAELVNNEIHSPINVEKIENSHIEHIGPKVEIHEMIIQEKFLMMLKHTLFDVISVNLVIATPIPWCQEFQWKLDDMRTNLQISSASHDSPTFPVTDIFRQNPRDSTNDEISILVEGATGYGKTTLASKIAYDWAYSFKEKKDSNKYIQDFSLVLVIPLRTFEGVDFEDKLFRNIFPSSFSETKKRKSLMKCLEKNKENILLILDDVENFVEMFFSRSKNYEGKKSLLKVLTVSEKPIYSHLSACPLFLLLLCCMAEEKGEDLPSQSTEVMKELTNCSMRRCLMKQGINIQRPFVDKNCNETLLYLGLLSFSGLLKGQGHLSELEMLLKAEDECGNKLLETGLFHQVTTANVIHDQCNNTILQPIHQIFMEFLASYYLYSKFQSTDEIVSKLILMYHTPNDMIYTLIFLGGLLKEDAHELYKLLPSDTFRFDPLAVFRLLHESGYTRENVVYIQKFLHSKPAYIEGKDCILNGWLHLLKHPDCKIDTFTIEWSPEECVAELWKNISNVISQNINLISLNLKLKHGCNLNEYETENFLQNVGKIFESISFQEVYIVIREINLMIQTGSQIL
ncbi:Down syndrome cell adhesion molecule-like protein Dscam2 [Nymphon striatum]|nr:Down syndrome cell adhesion molecule-like protein Dscam2 [Nymphon striatum]